LKFSNRGETSRKNEAPTDFVDVKSLIRALSEQDLLASADAYFATLDESSEQCRKPFSNPKDAPRLCRNLGLLFDAADLFRGATVLDFGCATGWLTLALADMGCNVVGVDISPAAVALAERLKARPTMRERASAQFISYKGQQIPVESGSFDRVLCYDAFHHVRDQRETLREFARVLRPGGRVAMMEPGPFHSKTPQSQAEMKRFRVIENDVSMSEIISFAGEVGLDPPSMLVQFQHPLALSSEEFLMWSASAMPRSAANSVVSSLRERLLESQCFFMTKGSAPPDSRRPEGLAAELWLLDVISIESPEGRSYRISIRIRNTGSCIWLTGPGAAPGVVRIGVQVMGGKREFIEPDFWRVDLPANQVAIGEEVSVVFEMPQPKQAYEHLRIDLVSEQVTWFDQTGRIIPIDLPFVWLDKIR